MPIEGYVFFQKMSIGGGLTLWRCGMLCFEFLQVLLISVELGGLLVFGQLCVVFLLGSIRLAFAGLPSIRRQDLPPFADHLGDFCEGKFLAFQSFPHLCGVLVVDSEIHEMFLRLENIT